MCCLSYQAQLAFLSAGRSSKVANKGTKYRPPPGALSQQSPTLLIINLPLVWFYLDIFPSLSVPGKLTPSPSKSYTGKSSFLTSARPVSVNWALCLAIWMCCLMRCKSKSSSLPGYLYSTCKLCSGEDSVQLQRVAGVVILF